MQFLITIPNIFPDEISRIITKMKGLFAQDGIAVDASIADLFLSGDMVEIIN